MKIAPAVSKLVLVVNGEVTTPIVQFDSMEQCQEWAIENIRVGDYCQFVSSFIIQVLEVQ